MNNQIVEKSREWFASERPVFERFAESIRTTLESLISQAGLEFLSVTARVKDIESFSEKIMRKGYSEPERQMTDIVGLRVILYIESDADRLCEMIKEWFNPHLEKSIDKGSELGKDRFGYRSVHFVCDLGQQRLSLPENTAYQGHVFEIQVRTVLQHAWAEIQHDRGYKFAGILPPEFERHLYRQAAILEGVDREFDRLSRDLDEYSRQVTDKAKAGDLDIEINSTSLRSYIEAKPELRLPEPSYPYALDRLTEELIGYGIATLAQLDQLLKGFPYLNEAEQRFKTYIGPIRAAIMYDDLDKYFNSAYQRGWKKLTPYIANILIEKYGEQKVNQLLEQHKLLTE